MKPVIRISRRCQFLVIVFLSWCCATSTTFSQEAIPATPAQPTKQIKQLITLEHVSPQEILPTLESFISPKGSLQEGAVHSLPSVNAIMVIDFPHVVDKIRQHIAEIEEFASIRKAKEKAVREAELQMQRKLEEERKRADEARVKSTQPNYGESPKPNQAANTRPTSDVIGEVQALRDDSRRLLALLEKKASQTPTAVKPSNRFSSQSPEKQPQQVLVIRPIYLNMDDAIEICESLVDGGTCRKLTNDRGLVVVCAPERLDAIRQCISQLDVEPTSIMIRATLCQVGVEELTASGIGIDRGMKLAQPILPNPPAPEASPKQKSHQEMFQKLKQTCPSLKVLAQPSLLVADGEVGEISVGSEIPLQQLTQTDQGGSIGTTTFRLIGTQLEFAPTVNEHGQISLNIKSDLSAVAEWTEKNGPVIDRRRLTTGLRVIDGEATMVIGLGCGLPIGLRSKKPGTAESTTENLTETVLIVTAEILPPRQSQQQKQK